MRGFRSAAHIPLVAEYLAWNLSALCHIHACDSTVKLLALCPSTLYSSPLLTNAVGFNTRNGRARATACVTDTRLAAGTLYLND
ncbi:hypothetical protein CC78DRAFT_143607 [Lojkania enalia]|uniref:Uncharacterized protein n=1 Tax=Lojkania enalia TaxID=147567 RepID=A0A9P4JZY2_9PLEO|nr:hypothetical protein CC78DRAFT_143607 [Didymosphaeria enalia]